MNDHHVVRRGALLALCQFESGREDENDTVREGLLAADISERLVDEAMGFAIDVWSARESMDDLIRPLTTEWPRHRQPLLDRCLLRLAAFEISSSRVPPKIAINEAIELAREFSTAESPRFVNGVLDRLWHETPEQDSVTPQAEDHPPASGAVS
ncbi:MAG: transcription antitermination factor NusB [Planctomycetes bacterium]|nr:transcription antitermination factor NusB [Planctomycetota bacterium]MCP4837753.1 transcription antitermination factor NusB [Planctomycetota bacterium]